MIGSSFLCVLTVFVVGCSHSTEPPLALPFTAKENLNDANLLGQSYRHGLRLVSVFTENVTVEGVAPTWQYLYYYPCPRMRYM